MLDIGIDFGSTYTTVSTYRADRGVPEAIQPSEAASSPFIPTVAALHLKNRRMKYGDMARGVTGQKQYQVFKAFKMLLNETDAHVLEERGYTQEYDPATVAKLFLSDLIEIIAAREGQGIHKLVIGAPEIWFKQVGTLESRGILRNICRGINNISEKNVAVVSEPAAACAFFAHNYFLERKKNYNGTILLVDYGGGTLDISLTQVIPSDSRSGIQMMEIKVLECNGAGENVDRMVGQAGILYMESVMKRAIEDAGLEVTMNGKFFQAVNSLEKELQGQIIDIRETFEEIGVKGTEEDLEDEELAEIEYAGETVSVNYRQLLEVYNEKIYPVLDAKLTEMVGFMKDHGISYLDNEQENFKIALVGGFGNFYLVDRQLRDKFKLSTHGKLMDGIPTKASDREKAISYGAALLAAGVIGIRQTAPFSIGLYQKENDKPCLDYCFRYREDIEFNKVYYPIDRRGELVPSFIASDSISQFVINLGHKKETAMIATVKERFRRELTNIVKSPYHTAVIGFSLDSSEVISIHVRDYDLMNGKITGEDHAIELAKFGELFEVTRVTTVF